MPRRGRSSVFLTRGARFPGIHFLISPAGANTYLACFTVRIVLFLRIAEHRRLQGQWIVFEAALFGVFTMSGEGLATIPALIADLFGAGNAGSIHGVILTAWSATARVGPVIITERFQSGKS